MLSDTIWSNGNGATSPHHTTYRTVLDQVDPEVAKILSNSTSANNAASINGASASNGNSIQSRRFSLNDTENGIFGFKRESLSAVKPPGGYAASTGGGAHSPHSTPINNKSGQQHINFGTASISGGIANRHPPQDNFFQKFSSVADATRDIELSNNFSGLNLEKNSRRTSFNQMSDNQIKPLTENGSSLLTSPHGSLNENLNMPAPRTSRHQSISEKIDSYNNNSPIQASAALSINSDITSPSNIQSNPNVSNPSNNHIASNGNNKNTHGHAQGFWNPATATSFTPSNSYGYFNDHNSLGNMPLPPQGFNPYGRNQIGGMGGPMSPPPFMIPSPPPPQFMDPNLYGMMNFGNASANNMIPSNEDGSEKVGYDAGTNAGIDSKETDDGFTVKENSSTNNGPPRNVHTPGIGLLNRQLPPTSGFMFQAFNPYNVFQPSPPLNSSDPASPQLENIKTMDSTQPKSIDGNLMNQSSGSVTPQFVDNNGHSSQSTRPPRKGNSKASQSNGQNSHSNGNGNKVGGGSHIYRSPLLEEVRSNFKGKEYYLKDIYGHAVEFTKDQHGSRFIQQKLPDATDEEKEVIFNEIRDISYELMTDVFGNYVIQKYFEHGSVTQQKVLLESMIGHIYELSLQMYGCRVVQRALEAIELAGQIQIIEELKDYILICAKDQNGNHVIQKSIERIPFNKIGFVLESLDNQIYHLSTHPYGCRVIQRLLEHSDIEDQKKILDELNRFIFYLIQDQYGNYVMQHILERGNPNDREEILKIVLGSVVNFSKHKFASNVIEKCIKYGTLEQRKRILYEVMLGNEDANVELVNDDSPLALMVKDQYANYVIQKLVEGFDAKSEEKKKLVSKLRQYLKQISLKNTYGKHLASVEKMIIVAENALADAERGL